MMLKACSLEPKRLYNGPFYGDPHTPSVSWAKHDLGEVPEGHYTVPFESVRKLSEGDDLTILAYGTMVWVAEAAAKEAGYRGHFRVREKDWTLSYFA